MIVVIIIGLLAVMAIPTFVSIKRRATHFRFMNDVRVFKDALETYYLEEGVLPPNSSPGALDASVAEYIKAEIFAAKSPIGGQWDIESDSSGIVLGVGVVGYTIDTDQLTKLDDRFDDGDLSAGRLRSVGSGGYFYVIE